MYVRIYVCTYVRILGFNTTEDGSSQQPKLLVNQNLFH